MPLIDKPCLRKDAQANQAKILAAARELIGERGTQFSMDDVACSSGVGVGTIYRRYASKQDLIEAVFAERVDVAIDNLTATILIADPWQGFVETMAQAQILFQEFQALLYMRSEASSAYQDRQLRAYERMEIILHRAQAAGVVREDLSVQDLAPLFSIVSSHPISHPAMPDEIRQRVLQIVLDGCRPTDSILPAVPPEIGTFSAALTAIRAADD